MLRMRSPSLSLVACSAVIKAGKAYMDDTPREAMQDERMRMVDSKYRCVGQRQRQRGGSARTQWHGD
jgi:hypothetical protein